MDNSRELKEKAKKKKSRASITNKLSGKLKTITLGQNIINFPERDFSDKTYNEAVNLLIYGIKILKYYKNGKFSHGCYFYILEDDTDYLQWLSSSKCYSKSRINLKTIKNIYDDPNSDSKIRKFFKRSKKKYLFLTYKDENINKEETIILKFPSIDKKYLWWQGIQIFMKKSLASLNGIRDQRKILAQKLFIKADKDGNKCLDVDEVKKVLAIIHIEIDKNYLKKFFQKYDVDNNNVIDINEFQKVIEDISKKSELLPIFKKYAKISNNKTNDELEINQISMNLDELMNFYKKEQKQILSSEDARSLVLLLGDAGSDSMLIGDNSIANEYTFISFSEFSSLIFSQNNSIFDPEKAVLYQNMDMPLTEYYINSSHNTYLTANQLTSESSTKAYIDAIARGCRCVELDIWEGEYEPIIYHGFTLTTKILFEDVIKTINDYAFVNNPYPLILSFENHCQEKFQDRMAEILKRILGDKIYVLPQNYLNYDCLPSPNELKYKILIKDKTEIPFFEPQTKDLNTFEIKEVLDEDSEDKEEEYINMKSYNIESHTNSITISHKKNLSGILSPKAELNPMISLTKSPINNSPKASKKQNIQTSFRGMNSNSLTSSEKKKNKKQIFKTQNLISLISLYGIKISFSLTRSIWNITSLKENVFLKLSKSRENKIIDYHKNYLTRIYPSASRVDSSNYDSIEFFNLGVQFIALNVQTCDLNLLIYFSKFIQNGGAACGYVLKPDFYSKYSFHPKYLKDFKRIKKIFIINLISGQQLKDSENEKNDKIDPFVEINMRGIPNDEEENPKIFKSKIVRNNGFNPIFDLECQFKVYCPELAFLIFNVYSEEKGLTKNKRLGWYSIPFNCIRPGYRVVQLFGPSLFPIDFCYLLVKIEIKDVMD